MIVGNVAEYIERCLRSFAPHADEVSMVRAIGNQTPDETETIARRVCAELGKPLIWTEYKNAPAHAEWPHVDSFAAARQQSYDQATGEYAFWCDSDDVLKCGGERIRQLAELGQYACYMFPYDVLGKNVVVNRERMMRRDAGKWKSAVHEFFEFTVHGTTAAFDDGVVFLHLPKLSKQGSNDRNLRILESIPADEMTPGLKYHLFNELLGAKRTTEAIELGAALIEGDVLATDEKYDVLMSLMILTNDLGERKVLLHEAHKTDPTRREALGILATTAIDENKPASALAYARQMAATTEPSPHPWNSRRPFYGYVGDEIYQQALRINGRNVEADLVRRDSLKRHGGPKIALLHATRGRAEKAAKCRKAWFDLASEPGRIEHIFAIDDDDRASDSLRRFHHISVPAGGGCVRAWNFAANATDAPIVVQLSDDWIPCAQWDDLICKRIGDPGLPRVLAINDGHRKDKLLCMAICTRAYLAEDNFLFHPLFFGVYSDNWFTDCAYARGVVIEAPEIVFEHRHPFFGKGEPDATYARQNDPKRYEEGRAVYEHLKGGTNWCSVPGFFNYHDFYMAIAARLNDGETAVEIGTWLGRSIICLAQTLKQMGKFNCKLYVVDTFKGESNQKEHEATVKLAGGNLRSKFEENIRRCGVDDMITVIEGDSAASAKEFADKSLAFCYIDAAHDYDSVVRDIRAWQPKVKDGGILAGHDYDWHEVAKAVNENVKNPKQIGNVWIQ